MPIRIYDVAKKLGLENKDVLAKAKALGISAKVPSSMLDKITAEYLEQQILEQLRDQSRPLGTMTNSNGAAVGDARPTWAVPAWIPKAKKSDCDGLEVRWERTLLREEGKCVYCGLDLLSSTELLLSAELDHLVPEQVFRGQGESSSYTKGGEYRANLVLCCGPCNDAKANWPLCLSKQEADTFLTKTTRDQYLEAARKFTISRRRVNEARCASLMARGWHQRHSLLKMSMNQQHKA